MKKFSLDFKENKQGDFGRDFQRDFYRENQGAIYGTLDFYREN